MGFDLDVYKCTIQSTTYMYIDKLYCVIYLPSIGKDDSPCSISVWVAANRLSDFFGVNSSDKSSLRLTHTTNSSRMDTMAINTRRIAPIINPEINGQFNGYFLESLGSAVEIIAGPPFPTCVLVSSLSSEISSVLKGMIVLCLKDVLLLKITLSLVVSVLYTVTLLMGSAG